MATATVAFAFFDWLTVFVYTELIHPLVMWSLVQVEHLVVYALHLLGFCCTARRTCQDYAKAVESTSAM